MTPEKPRIPPYAELLCLSNFSFLRGASRPEELVERAQALGYSALALTDECSLAGIVRAHVAAKEQGLKLLVGSQFQVQCDAPFTLIVLATNLNGYGNLCEFITRLRRTAPKGTYRLTLNAISPDALADGLVIAVPQRGSTQAQMDSVARWLLLHFVGRCWLGVEQLRLMDDEMRLHRLRQSSELTAVPLVAVGDVHMHLRSRKALQDVLTATRIGKPLTECGHALAPNAEQRLRSRLALAQRYPEALLAETLQVAGRCAFSLDELRYQYPSEVVPPGETPASHLRRLAYEGMGRRWPAGAPASVQQQVEHELALISELQYEHYFLTVYDIVAFARSQHILCQGRGSAANSAVCYCLGVTEVDPARTAVLFERFISKERNEPPDIDVDFEHERREEVIQYLYTKYGRERAALTATVISYRPRSALRDVGKALGFDEAALDALGSGHRWWSEDGFAPERILEAGLDPDSLKVRQLVALTGQLMGFPRHLSQHTGGFVLTQMPLSRMVPIENAAMADRTVIEWDKDDLDAMGLLKVDVLALGMLTAIRKSLDFIGQRKGFDFQMQDIPAEDASTYDMICAADTVGVFQIESRAQMSMLPRLRPREFYDLVIEVALVRPGPIQGGAVHPYLNRRQGKEPIDYPKGLDAALKRTLGVPVFQEQCMQIAIIAAGFTPGEADGLRRAMAAWKRKGGLGKYQDRLLSGMAERGYELDFAQRVVEQIKGFSSYGFPESHAASFALLVYASCWIKRHHPAEFLAAMLNSQPLGFYTPSQLVQDAVRHGVEVRAVDVMESDWDCTLEEQGFDSLSPWERAGVRAAPSPSMPAVRLGFRMVSGLSHDEAQRLVSAREEAAFTDSEDLARRANLDKQAMQQLAAADALQSLSGHRRQQVWDAAALKTPPALLKEAPVEEDALDLPEAPEGEAIMWDYASLGLTLRRHPLALLRERLQARRFMTAEALKDAPDGRLVRACGIVTGRQQPGTSKGVVFVTLEDETGVVQVIVWKALRERQRSALTRSRLMAVHGVWQREGEVCNLIAGHLEDLSPLLGRLATESRDFH
ncbi:MAG: error-prone DNA polymerase [Gammaproteobacteria bacterium]|uniref:error-prone DNA polymerase n=1 Tax=Hydrogenophaga sp. TaxID=1904254 RepID=UPI0008CCEA13|nr:error-prone DNA polymerase [Hydrogenophaga sp.]MBU4183034.1 error-prone DNA polymerase [Gammaproteobacteria bacterium]OGB32802.1 MAG: error-prone DNA polymerase [Burkholderiales bacterium RIFCSPLOWO2_02_FULL_66_35]MBU4280700.1 error-prone DNA polymerase [Gammaproteobacteria bacterium]MBU4323815.1 error-prone DNA polymerase [Gammaproteobacteria bacterium]MBU4506109.1 error-prone DNA polymerase [Gammaproteobacteria bacterium]